MTKKFTRTIEDFVCENCSAKVIGNGYTNHCPKCLFSKHVDVNPGDRACDCMGLMEPIFVAMKKGEYIISFKCKKCGFERQNKTAKEDSFEEIIRIAAKPS